METGTSRIRNLTSAITHFPQKTRTEINVSRESIEEIITYSDLSEILEKM
jgi:hypothetical protein